jgi:hypothetical protein
MSYITDFARPRSVRLTRKTDSLLEAEAARQKKTVSELIREKVEGNLTEEMTASEMILGFANHPPRKRITSARREAFRKAYLERHKQ